MYVGSPPCMWVPNHAFGFPTMYFDQRYQVSGIRFNAYALRIARFTHCSLYALPLYALPALRLKLEVEGVWNSPVNGEDLPFRTRTTLSVAHNNMQEVQFLNCVNKGSQIAM